MAQTKLQKANENNLQKTNCTKRIAWKRLLKAICIGKIAHRKSYKANYYTNEITHSKLHRKNYKSCFQKNE